MRNRRCPGPTTRDRGRKCSNPRGRPRSWRGKDADCLGRQFDFAALRPGPEHGYMGGDLRQKAQWIFLNHDPSCRGVRIAPL